VLQKDIDWDSFAVNFWLEAQGRVWHLVNNQWELKDVPAIGPEGTRNMFALSILLTGEPQYVSIKSNTGGGHAMIVYAVTRDALHVADPNYPGDINRTIYYSNGVFDPYPSGDNWDEINAGRGKLYETILYLAKSTLMPWDHITGRWQEVKNGTIGNNVFPGYDIKYLNEDSGEYELLGENQVFTKDKGDFIVSSTSGQEIMAFDVYRDGVHVPFHADWKTGLVPGDNLLGFNIGAELGDDSEYVDFKYVNVIHEPEDEGPIEIIYTVDYGMETDYEGETSRDESQVFTFKINPSINTQADLTYNINEEKLEMWITAPWDKDIVIEGVMQSSIIPSVGRKTYSDGDYRTYTYSNPEYAILVPGGQQWLPGNRFSFTDPGDSSFFGETVCVYYDFKVQKCTAAGSCSVEYEYKAQQKCFHLYIQR
jgi:hypothetical protein